MNIYISASANATALSLQLGYLLTQAGHRITSSWFVDSSIKSVDAVQEMYNSDVLLYLSNDHANGADASFTYGFMNALDKPTIIVGKRSSRFESLTRYQNVYFVECKYDIETVCSIRIRNQIEGKLADIASEYCTHFSRDTHEGMVIAVRSTTDEEKRNSLNELVTNLTKKMTVTDHPGQLNLPF
jgi:hypothetical protein